MKWRGIGAVAAGAVAAGLLLFNCFKTPDPECAFLCGAGNACPTDYFCATDGVCKHNGIADSFDCGFTAPDDASPPVDAAIDAPGIDAAPDASLEDAGVDAS